MPADPGDIIRVIGKFAKANNYTLTLDSEEVDTESGDAQTEPKSSKYASFVIIEPKIMISTTAIVTSFPCVRKSVFSENFRNTATDFSYPLVIGNILHDCFETLIQADTCAEFPSEEKLHEVF